MNKHIALILLVFLTSCTTYNYFQTYKATADNGKLVNNKIDFEDKNCIVSYNLWGDGGDFSFNIYNKTESDITIDLTKTFFVLNGVAHEYFKNRTLTKTSNFGTTLTTYAYPFWNNNAERVSGSTSSGISISYAEQPELTIPAKTSINISEFVICKQRYSSCTLIDFPSKRQMETLNYDINNSPIVFSNLISYSCKGETNRFENKFYVSELTNVPEYLMYKTVDTNECGRKIFPGVQIYKNATPFNFYIKYSVPH